MVCLPKLTLTIPEWTEDTFDSYTVSSAKLQKISRSAGTGSDRFEKSCDRVLSALKSKCTERVIESIKQAIDVRAYTYIVSHTKFNLDPLFSNELFNHLEKVRFPMSRLSLLQLIRSYITHFDKLGEFKRIKNLTDFISKQLEARELNRGDIFSTIAANQEIILNNNAPALIVERAISQKRDLQNIISELYLNNFPGARLLEITQYHYYIEQLKNIPLGERHPLLTEVCRDSVTLVPCGENQLLGHKVLEILIDRSIGKSLSSAWQKTILSIAGDPRVPKSSKKFMLWWDFLGEKRIAAMRGWLSRFDLKLFLTALEQSAKDLSNADMERMYTSRKVFMEGLLKQGLISESRLFLSDQAVKYLYRHYSRNELPDFARVNSPETSMIYLNLKGKAHIIEGSHSFPLKIYDCMPVDAKIDNYSVQKFDDSDLRNGVSRKYEVQNKNRKKYLDLIHDKNLAWQYKAMRYISRRGLDIDPFEIMEREKVKRYRSKYGAI